MPGSHGLVVRTPFVPFARGATFGFAAAPGGAALVSGKLGEECGGCHDERHVTVPAMPGAGLAMVQPEIVLGAQEAFLDVIFPRFGGHTGLSGHALLGLLGG